MAAGAGHGFDLGPGHRLAGGDDPGQLAALAAGIFAHPPQRVLDGHALAHRVIGARVDAGVDGGAQILAVHDQPGDGGEPGGADGGVGGAAFEGAVGLAAQRLGGGPALFQPAEGGAQPVVGGAPGRPGGDQRQRLLKRLRAGQPPGVDGVLLRRGRRAGVGQGGVGLAALHRPVAGRLEQPARDAVDLFGGIGGAQGADGVGEPKRDQR